MNQLESLHERMRGVYLDGKFVGEVLESEWLAIVAQVDSDQRLWKAQIKNLLRVAARAFGMAFISVPMGAFWSVVILGWMGKPIIIGAGWHLGSILNHPQIVVTSIVFSVAVMHAIGLKLGYVNFFGKARSALLKAHLDIEEPGDADVR